MTNILVVDYNANTGFRLKKIFEGHQVNFTTVSTASEAISRLHRQYEIIIIDINLGPDDGFELIQKIQDHNSTSTVVITTSINTRKAFVRGIRLGAADYILKPYEDTYIKGKLLKHIKEIEANVPKNTAAVEEIVYRHIEKALKNKHEMLVGLVVVFNTHNPTQMVIKTPIVKGFFAKLEKTIFSLDLLADSVKYTGESVNYGMNGKVFIIDALKLSDKENVVAVVKGIADEMLSTSEYGYEMEFMSLPYELNAEERVMDTLSKRIEESLGEIGE